MKVVKATEEDIPALNSLVHLCYRGPEAFQAWTMAANEEEITQHICREATKRKITFLKGVNDAGEMIACCLTFKQTDAMFAGMLYVQPHLQGLGVEKKMMRGVAAWAKENHCSKTKVEVITAKKALIQWYELLGFHATGKQRPFPLPSTVDQGLVLMELEKPLDATCE